VKDLFALLIAVLSWIAVPVLLLAAYNHWVLEPKRPRSPEGVAEPAPVYIRAANFLVPFVIVAAVYYIGVSVVFGWIKEISQPLSWFALPVGLWCAIDSWWLAPRRKLAHGAEVKDPPLVRAAYTVLPVLIIAVVVRMITAEKLDFSVVLLALSCSPGWPGRSITSYFASSATRKRPNPAPSTMRAAFFRWRSSYSSCAPSSSSRSASRPIR